MRTLRPAFHLAQEVGAQLGERQVLLTPLWRRREIRASNAAPGQVMGVLGVIFDTTGARAIAVSGAVPFHAGVIFDGLQPDDFAIGGAVPFHAGVIFDILPLGLGAAAKEERILFS